MMPFAHVPEPTACRGCGCELLVKSPPYLCPACLDERDGKKSEDRQQSDAGPEDD